MHYFRPLLVFIPMIAVLGFSEAFREFTLINGVAQLVLFLFVVHIPAYRTGRMSYVDIGWPLGLAVIGGLVIVLGEGTPLRRYAIGGLYLFMGLRMGLMALLWWSRGVFKVELPRYKFQRIRWGRERKKNITLAMQVDIFLQGLANVSFLALPAMLIAGHSAAGIHALEVAGVMLWLAAFVLETIADQQKQRFVKQAREAGDRKAVCDVGLWKYTRHPNYFFEWMVWNSLIVASIPAWLALFQYPSAPADGSGENLIVWLGLGLGLLFISRIMYTTLVFFTGALPSEYYSVKKRPGYKTYRKTTNMFFPGPSRSLQKD